MLVTVVSKPETVCERLEYFPSTLDTRVESPFTVC